LYKKADITIKNDANETAKDVAIRRGFDKSVIDLFFGKILLFM
jgi:hypothetical protein